VALPVTEGWAAEWERSLQTGEILCVCKWCICRILVWCFISI